MKNVMNKIPKIIIEAEFVNASDVIKYQGKTDILRGWEVGMGGEVGEVEAL